MSAQVTALVEACRVCETNHLSLEGKKHLIIRNDKFLRIYFINDTIHTNCIIYYYQMKLELHLNTITSALN